MASPQFESPIPVENSDQIMMIVVSAFAILVPTIFIGLRLYARMLTHRKVDGSDWCIMVAQVFNIAVHVDCWLMVLKGGFGFHLQDVAIRFGPDTLTFFFKAILAFCILWNATLCFSKLSVLLLYTTLMPMRSMILPARALGGFVILWNSANILAQLLICKPFAMNWDVSIGGTCGSQRDFYFSMGLINIVTDVAMLALPMPFIYKLKLPLRKKIALSGMFAVGIVTCGVSIYRQVTLPGMEFSDMTHSGLLPTMLSAIEPPVAISLACIPYLRPILGGGWAATNSKYNISGNSNGYSKSGARKGDSRKFGSLNDDSEVELQPTNPGFTVEVSRDSHHGAAKPDLKQEAIRVETRWEVSSQV